MEVVWEPHEVVQSIMVILLGFTVFKVSKSKFSTTGDKKINKRINKCST